MSETTLDNFISQATAGQAQAPAQPFPPAQQPGYPPQDYAQAPAQQPAKLPPPETIVAILTNPPAGADPLKLRAQFEATYDLSSIPLPGPAQAPAPVVAPAPAPMPAPARASDGQPPTAGTTPAPATPGQEQAPLRRGAPAKAAKGITKADRLKFALAALQGGTITIAEAERYYDPKAGGE